MIRSESEVPDSDKTLLNTGISGSGFEPGFAMIEMIESAGRIPRQRSTAYGEVSLERQSVGLRAPELNEIENTPAQKYERTKRRELVRPGIQV